MQEVCHCGIVGCLLSQLTMQQIAVSSGPYAGQKAFVHVRTPRVSLDRLPLELRNMVYGFCFLRGGPINIRSGVVDIPSRRCRHSQSSSKDSRRRSEGHADDSKDPIGGLNVLLINRQFGKEAKEFLYRGQTFVFGTRPDYILFMKSIGKSTRFLTHLNLRLSRCSRHVDCYNLLKNSPHLSTVNFALSSQYRGPITTHIDRQFEDMKEWLFHDNADQQTAPERLRKVSFEIGAHQSGVLDQQGDPLEAMTPDLRDGCLRRMQRHLEKHFGKTRTSARSSR